MVEFKLRHHNRLKFPTKSIWIVEDDLSAQADFVAWARARFEPQGECQFDFMASGIGVASSLLHLTPDILILDHDLPFGNASDLLQWMKENGKTNIPVLTASGVPENNDHMLKFGTELGIEVHRFMKYEVYQGKADGLILELLRRGKQESRTDNGLDQRFQA
jgi:CheY-like chemotaxis protein